MRRGVRVFRVTFNSSLFFLHQLPCHQLKNKLRIRMRNEGDLWSIYFQNLSLVKKQLFFREAYVFFVIAL